MCLEVLEKFMVVVVRWWWGLVVLVQTSFRVQLRLKLNSIFAKFVWRYLEIYLSLFLQLKFISQLGEG